MMRIVLGLLAYIAVVLFGHLVFPAPARAHDWYPSRCCSGGDCMPVPDAAVTPTPKGFHIVWRDPVWGEVNEFVAFAEIEPSQDGQYHMCLRPPTSKTRIRCFFAPLSY